MISAARKTLLPAASRKERSPANIVILDQPDLHQASIEVQSVKSVAICYINKQRTEHKPHSYTTVVNNYQRFEEIPDRKDTNKQND